MSNDKSTHYVYYCDYVIKRIVVRACVCVRARVRACVRACVCVSSNNTVLMGYDSIIRQAHTKAARIH